MNAVSGRRRYRSRVERAVAAVGVVAVFRAAARALRRQAVPAVILSAAVAAPVLVEAVSPLGPSYVPLAPLQALWGIFQTIGVVRIWPYLPELTRAGIAPPNQLGWYALGALCELLYAAALTVAGAALMLLSARARRGDELLVLRALRARFRPLSYAALASGFLTVVVYLSWYALLVGLKSSVPTGAWELVAHLSPCAFAPLFLVPQLGFAFAVLYEVDAVNALGLAWRFAIDQRLAYSWMLAIALFAAYAIPAELVGLVIGYLAKDVVPGVWPLVWRLVELVLSVALFAFLTAAATAAAGGYWRQGHTAA